MDLSILWVECNLLHERKPILTGRRIKDPIKKEMGWEIIWKCEICENQSIKQKEIL